MKTPATRESQHARPIGSLISKSEKAQQKLTPGTWQHSMLRDNLKALRIASALMNNDATEHFTREEFRDALQAFAAMISRSEAAQSKFAPGTSQHTLLRNRLAALRAAEVLAKAAADKFSS